MQISKAPGDSAGHGMGCHPLFLFFTEKNTKDTIILCYIRIKIKVCFFYRSGPDDKHSNTQYIRQENIIMAK